MRLHTIFIAVFLALAALPASAGSKTASSLDRLFGALHATTDPDEANRLTGLIWVIWNHAEDPETDRLMTEGREAMERLDFDTALARFTAVVEREPNFAEGWNKRATLYYVMGRYRDSIGDIDRVLDLEPRHFGALSGMGMIYMELGDDEAAVRAMEEALAVNPHMPGVRQQLEALRKKLQDRAI